MNDLLLEVTKSPAARGLIQSLGLPIPLPEPLVRPRGAWEAQPLEGKTVIVGAGPAPELLSEIGGALAQAGASLYGGTGGTDLLGPLGAAGEGYARRAQADTVLDANARIHALVFDASAIKDVNGLREVHDFFHTRVGRIARSGRIVVIGRARSQGRVDHTTQAPEGRLGADESPEAVAAQAALSGFVRSVAKEIGRKGATANLVLVERGAEARLGPVVRWLLEDRSAFVTAQPLVVSMRAIEMRPPAYLRPLDGQVALVTGAARGIGRATALALAAEGAHVFVADRPDDADAVSSVARTIAGTALLVDVTEEDASAVIKAALGSRGADIIVHNAGITRDKTLGRMKVEHWDAVMAVNLEAIVRITEALEKIALRDGGRIICLSSVSGIAGNVGQSNYGASKAAIVGYVAALGARLAKRGITANAIAPGFIETRMTAAIPLVIRQAGRRLSALGQGGQPEDVAQAITFLASPGAQGITGRTLRVCGGALIGA